MLVKIKSKILLFYILCLIQILHRIIVPQDYMDCHTKQQKCSGIFFFLYQLFTFLSAPNFIQN